MDWRGELSSFRGRLELAQKLRRLGALPLAVHGVDLRRADSTDRARVSPGLAGAVPRQPNTACIAVICILPINVRVSANLLGEVFSGNVALQLHRLHTRESGARERQPKNYTLKQTKKKKKSDSSA